MEGGSGEVQRDLQREIDALKARVDVLERLTRSILAAGPGPKQKIPTLEKVATPEMVSSETAVAPSRGATLESRIGARLFNRVGILAVLAGMAWFLKLAIDREWIGPGIRVLLGLTVAIALVAWSERFRARAFTGFSHTLKALGTGIAYLSLWAAFGVYRLLPGPVAFAAMVAVTLANATLAWRQSSELLAGYSLIGGLVTPVLLSAGRSEELFLFSYLLLLDAGAVALMTLRSWPRLVIGAFTGTTIYFGLWWAQFYLPNEAALTASFIVMFFALFTAASLLAARHQDRQFRLSELPLAVAACTFIEAYELLKSTAAAPYAPWSAAALGLCYAALTIAFRNGTEGRNRLRIMHLALAAGLFALAPLLHFRGYGLPLFWLAETLALTLLAVRFNSNIVSHSLRIASSAMAIASCASLLLLNVFDPMPWRTSAFLNPDFPTYLAGAATFALVAWISREALRNQPAIARSWHDLHWDSWVFLGAFATVAFSLIALLGVDLQIEALWRSQLQANGGLNTTDRPAYIDLIHSAWYMLYGAALMAAGFSRRSAFLRWQALIVLSLSMAKVFLFDTSHLSQGYRVASFLALGALLLAISFAYQKDWLALRGDGRS